MGSPLSGRLRIVRNDGHKFEVHDSCGGPACWSKDSKRLAVPLWVGRSAWITVIDIQVRTLTGYEYVGAVLHIHSFEDGKIGFTDSPAYHARVLELDTAVFPINRVIQL